MRKSRIFISVLLVLFCLVGVLSACHIKKTTPDGPEDPTPPASTPPANWQDGAPSPELTFQYLEESDSYALTKATLFSFCDLTIPDTYQGKPVTAIGDRAFAYCPYLTGVVIPDSVTEIGDCAFQICWELARVVIGKQVAKIGREAFLGMKLVEIYNRSAYIPTEDLHLYGMMDQDALHVHTENEPSRLYTTADGYRFYEDDENSYLISYLGAGSDLVLPAQSPSGKTYHIFKGAFFYIYGGHTHRNLTSVVISDGVREIGDSAYLGCYDLSRVVIGKNVTKIGGDAFGLCYTLLEVWNHSQLPIEPGSEDHGGVGAAALHVYTDNEPSYQSVTADGYLFYEEGETSYLLGYAGTDTDLVLPARSPTGKKYAIHRYAFMNYKERPTLTSVIIPDGVTEIGDCAFESCLDLNRVVIGDGVTKIGSGAFAWCEDLSRVVIGKHVAEIGDQAFYSCDKLVEVWNHSQLPIEPGSEEDHGGVGAAALHVYTGNEPGNQSVTEDGYLFYEEGETSYLLSYTGTETSLTLPNRSPTGKNYALYSYAFSYPVDPSLLYLLASRQPTDIIIPDCVTEIGKQAFGDCWLNRIVIGKNVKKIEDGAFYSASLLSEVYYHGTPEEWGQIEIVDSSSSYYSNRCLLEATLYFYSEQPPTAAQWNEASTWWHYAADGVTPQAWPAVS